jgi:hypothetical protein
VPLSVDGARPSSVKEPIVWSGRACRYTLRSYTRVLLGCSFAASSTRRSVLPPDHSQKRWQGGFLIQAESWCRFPECLLAPGVMGSILPGSWHERMPHSSVRRS